MSIYLRIHSLIVSEMLLPVIFDLLINWLYISSLNRTLIILSFLVVIYHLKYKCCRTDEIAWGYVRGSPDPTPIPFSGPPDRTCVRLPDQPRASRTERMFPNERSICRRSEQTIFTNGCSRTSDRVAKYLFSDVVTIPDAQIPGHEIMYSA